MAGTRSLARPEGLRITLMRRDEDGAWRANVHLDGEHMDVFRPQGLWLTAAGDGTRELLPPAQAALNKRMREVEREQAKVPA